MKTALKIVSALQLIGGILLAVLGIVNSGMYVSLATVAASGAEGTEGMGLLAAVSILTLVLDCALAIACGVLGLRAAKDPRRAMPAVVVGGIRLALALISLAASFSVDALLPCVVPVLYFGCALGLKKQAGQDALH